MYAYIKRKKRKRLPIILFVIVLLALSAIFYLRTVVAPVVKSVSEEEIRAKTTTAVNQAVMETVAEIPNFTDIVSWHYNAEQEVNSMTVNAVIVNGIVQNTTLKAQEKLESFVITGIEIPIGSLSGIMALSGKGPSVSVSTMPVGSINATLYSEFIEAGINQTNHRIFLRLSANVSVVLPGANNVVNTITDVIILESVIVGKIPETYLNSTSTQDMMDLIP